MAPATIRRIDRIDGIPGADAIDVATVGGWKTVVKKGEFSKGELAIFIEIDSWVPKDVAPFLFEGKAYNGVEGARLRTRKMRGQLSQGLLLPIANVSYYEGQDVSEQLGIIHWEKPIALGLAGMMRGDFPNCVPKTDQENCQNVVYEIFADLDALYEVTIKLDGASMSVIWEDGNMHVCSRNVDLKLGQRGNAYVDVALRKFAGEDTFGNIALQGELMGPGIQGNPEGLSRHEMYVFDIWDIDGQYYWEPECVRGFCRDNSLVHVPVLEEAASLRELTLTNVDKLLEFADGPSMGGNGKREGVVFKRADGKFSFKVVSNLYLLEER
jgi:RNA ligase (TIGR02306 family)